MTTKQYDIYYWNKHEYGWKWLAVTHGANKRHAIKNAKQEHFAFVQRGDVLRVELSPHGEKANTSDLKSLA